MSDSGQWVHAVGHAGELSAVTRGHRRARHIGRLVGCEEQRGVRMSRNDGGRSSFNGMGDAAESHTGATSEYDLPSTGASDGNKKFADMPCALRRTDGIDSNAIGADIERGSPYNPKGRSAALCVLPGVDRLHRARAERPDPVEHRCAGGRPVGDPPRSREAHVRPRVRRRRGQAEQAQARDRQVRCAPMAASRHRHEEQHTDARAGLRGFDTHVSQRRDALRPGAPSGRTLDLPRRAHSLNLLVEG